MTLNYKALSARLGPPGRWTELPALSRPYLLAALTALIIAIGAMLVQSNLNQRAARNRTLAETQTQLTVQQIGSLLASAESAQRGYLLSVDPAFLAQYRAAEARLGEELAMLHVQFADREGAAGAAHLRAIAAKLAAKQAEMDRTITLVRAGDGAGAIALMRSGEGKRIMDDLRGHLAALTELKRQQRSAAFASGRVARGQQIPLLVAMWVGLIALVWFGFQGERRRAFAEVEARQAGRLRELNARNALLARELDHRVRNLFGVVLAMIGIAGRRTGAVREVMHDLRQRVTALAEAHALALTPEREGHVGLEPVLTRLLRPYRGEATGRLTLRGPAVELDTRAITPLAMVVHELATNAIKYGALARPEGTVEIEWRETPGGVALSWAERGLAPPDPDPAPAPAPAPAAERPAGGFGTRMIDAAVRQLGGTIAREWRPGGLIVQLDLPLEPPGESPRDVE